MPRKPSSVFVIAETPHASVAVGGLPASQLVCWRVALEGDDTPQDAAERQYEKHPVGTRLFVVEDTKVDAFEVGLRLDQVDDPRLQEGDEEGEGELA